MIYIHLYVPLISRKVSVLLGAKSAAKNMKTSAWHHLDSSIYSYTEGMEYNLKGHHRCKNLKKYGWSLSTWPSRRHSSALPWRLPYFFKHINVVVKASNRLYVLNQKCGKTRFNFRGCNHVQRIQEQTHWFMNKKILTKSHILHPYCAIVFNNVALPHSSLIFSYTRHTQNTKEFWARLLQYRISMTWVKLILEKNDFGTRNFEINWSLNLWGKSIHGHFGGILWNVLVDQSLVERINKKVF